MTKHKLINDSLVRERDGVTARCECGWVSAGHFTSMGASAAFMDHQDKGHQTKENERWQ